MPKIRVYSVSENYIELKYRRRFLSQIKCDCMDVLRDP